MRRGGDGLLVPGLLLTLLAVAGVTLLLATGAPVLPRHLPGIPVTARDERRSVPVLPTPADAGNAADPAAPPPGTPGVPTAASPTPSRAGDRRPDGEPEPSRAGSPRPPKSVATSGPDASQPSPTPRPTRSGDSNTPATNDEPVEPVCRAGSASVVPVADTYVDQSDPDRGFGAAAELLVTSRGRDRNRRALVRFTLPAIPDGCSLASATLTLAAPDPSGRRLLVARAGGAWTESVTWDTAPAAAGSSLGATVSATRVTWPVTSLVAAMRTHGNHGFLVRDASESAQGAGAQTAFSARNTGAPPTLTVRWS